MDNQSERLPRVGDCASLKKVLSMLPDDCEFIRRDSELVTEDTVYKSGAKKGQIKPGTRKPTTFISVRRKNAWQVNAGWTGGTFDCAVTADPDNKRPTFVIKKVTQFYEWLAKWAT